MRGALTTASPLPVGSTCCAETQLKLLRRRANGVPSARIVAIDFYLGAFGQFVGGIVVAARPAADVDVVGVDVSGVGEFDAENGGRAQIPSTAATSQREYMRLLRTDDFVRDVIT